MKKELKGLKWAKCKRKSLGDVVSIDYNEDGGIEVSVHTTKKQLKRMPKMLRKQIKDICVGSISAGERGDKTDICEKGE